MEELAGILIVFTTLVLMPTAIFRGIKSLRESKSSYSEGSAMRRSDLQAMIDDAVIEATAPLAARIDELERELLMGDGRISPEAMAEAFDHDDGLQTATSRSRDLA